MGIKDFIIPSFPPGRLDDDLPTFAWQSLEEKKKIGSGSFEAVYKAKCENQDVAIKKSVEQYDDYYKRVFIKECKLLFSITHRNIVKFKAVCLMPLSVMLELCFFDFTPFGRDKQINNARDLLSYIHGEDICLLLNISSCLLLRMYAEV